MSEPPPLPDTTDFDWDSVEAPEECPDKFAVEVFASTLSWLITFCLSRQRGKDERTLGGRTNLKAGYRRFIALCYMYRPDLLDGRTVRALADELNVSRQEVNKFITDLSLEFKTRPRSHQHSNASRAIFRAAQLRRVAEANTKRKMNRPETRPADE